MLRTRPIPSRIAPTPHAHGDFLRVEHVPQRHRHIQVDGVDLPLIDSAQKYLRAEADPNPIPWRHDQINPRREVLDFPVEGVGRLVGEAEAGAGHGSVADGPGFGERPNKGVGNADANQDGCVTKNDSTCDGPTRAFDQSGPRDHFEKLSAEPNLIFGSLDYFTTGRLSAHRQTVARPCQTSNTYRGANHG